MKSSLLERAAMRVLGVVPQGLQDNRGFGGTYDERYEPETREDFVKAYIQRVYVQRCVNLIAASVDQVDLEVKVNGEWYDHEDVPKGDGQRLLDLMDRPNPRDPATTFLSWSTKWSQIVGEWSWEIIPARDKGIASLFPLRPYQVRIREAEGGGVKGYRYRPNGGTEVLYDAIDFQPGQVPATEGPEHPVAIFGRIPSPIDDYYGMPPLRGAKDDIISEYYAVRYDHRFFRNSARPDIVIGFKGKLEKKQRDANRESWEDFKGVDNAHRAAILDGEPSVTQLSQSPKDMEYADGRRMARENECAAFGVPPVLAGIWDRATYSNMEEARPAFWTGTMIPHLDFMISWAKWTLLPFYPGVEDLRHRADKVDAVQQAEKWRSEKAATEVSGGIATPNEGRQDTGRDEIDDVDEADQLHLPLTMIPLTNEPEPGAQPVDARAPSGDQVQQGDTGAGTAAAAEEAVKAAIRKSSWRKAQNGVEAWLRQRTLLLGRFSGRATTELTQHFASQRDEVMGIINGLTKSAELEDALRSYGWDTDASALAKIVDAMVAALAGESLNLTQILISAEELPDDQRELLVSRVLREVSERPDGIQHVSSRVRQEVIDQVRLGIEKGVTYRGIATGGVFDVGPAGERDSEKLVLKGVQGVYDEYTTWQGVRIARTESAYTFNHASGTLMGEAGIKQVEIMDGDEDEDCAAANGETWSVEEYMSDLLGHPNCTRVGLPKL